MPAPSTPAFDTLSLHAGQRPDPATGARAVPIYQTTSYVFDDTEHAADMFALKQLGNIYTRIMNPTWSVLEQRLAQLEGSGLVETPFAALALASGQAAVTYSVLNVTRAGDNIVAVSTLYGGTYNLFAHTLPQYGIEVRLVDPDRPEDPQLGQVGEHERRARAAHPGRRHGQPSARRRAPGVAPEPARVVAHLRLLEQLLGQHQRPAGVADEDGVGRERGGGAEARRHRRADPSRTADPEMTRLVHGGG